MTKRSLFGASLLLLGLVASSVIGARAAGAASLAWYEETPSSNPPFQAESAVAYDATSHQLVAFGGTEGSLDTNSTWAWDGSDWAQLNSPSSPADRAGAS